VNKQLICGLKSKQACFGCKGTRVQIDYVTENEGIFANLYQAALLIFA
jgi:hypothetical protein